jgi:hypothetical protein
VPCGMLQPPDPETRCEIEDVHVRRHVYRPILIARVINRPSGHPW